MSGDKLSPPDPQDKGDDLAGISRSEGIRLRISFAKTESMRYTGHLDLHRTWERTIRRAGLPLAYSQGYKRRPRLQLAMALPLGTTSECELLDAWFDREVDLSQARNALDKVAPPGLQPLSAAVISLREPPLQTQVRSAIYLVTLLEAVEDLGSRLDALLSTRVLPRVRRGKAYDLKPLIEVLSQIDPDGEGKRRLSMQLVAREGQTGRPDEVLKALEIPPESARVHRVQLILAVLPLQDALAYQQLG